ncbi:MAG: phage shock protein PspA [Deltaproteobacteria bacterium]|nr:phage shock protein PspA [Deltaproteobacteria bacterium]
MGIFTRLRDIVNSNLNAMLERAEDPEKLIKLMIMEMEDTLVEVKASAAGVMAQAKQARRKLDHCRAKASGWADKAQLAVDKGREDLAREALVEKRHWHRQAETQERELAELDGLVEQYHEDIRLLEAKLQEAQEKHRVLVQRAIHAQGKKKVNRQIRKASSHDALVRFEKFERRIDRAEAEAELVHFGRKPSLEEQFEELQENEEIEKELAELRANKADGAI